MRRRKLINQFLLLGIRGASRGRRRAGGLAVSRRRSPLRSPRKPGTRRRCGSCIRVGRPRRWSPRISGARTVVRRRSPLTPAATRGVGRGRRRDGRLAVSRRRSPLWSPRRLGAQTMARSASSVARRRPLRRCRRARGRCGVAARGGGSFQRARRRSPRRCRRARWIGVASRPWGDHLGASRLGSSRVVRPASVARSFKGGW